MNIFVSTADHTLCIVLFIVIVVAIFGFIVAMNHLGKEIFFITRRYVKKEKNNAQNNYNASNVTRNSIISNVSDHTYEIIADKAEPTENATVLIEQDKLNAVIFISKKECENKRRNS